MFKGSAQKAQMHGSFLREPPFTCRINGSHRALSSWFLNLLDDVGCIAECRLGFHKRTGCRHLGQRMLRLVLVGPTACFDDGRCSRDNAVIAKECMGPSGPSRQLTTPADNQTQMRGFLQVVFTMVASQLFGRIESR